MEAYKPEILAPAGQIKSVYGAFNAGADAVYLGAPLYSARAFAQNLSIEEICEALLYAHIHDKKIYLTMNTLLKNNEILDALKLLEPLYINGLDGIIVQDIGLIKLINEYYPELPIHGSTQLAITSHYGIETLKSMNVCRIVPARELTLDEIVAIKKTGLEVECFIHGAMCYCYSGKCLFSSIAGGRSGNRGRCAGPCRKEYDTYIDGKRVNSNEEKYPISMRDMCLINNICDFVDAGIDSFKIEGRMKAPEYSAGVSAIYRQVIDEYMTTGVRPKDKNLENELKQLYIRANTSTGYLYEENGRNMISLSSPSYQGISDKKREDIAEKYIDKVFRIPVSFDVYAYVGAPLIIEGYLASEPEKRVKLEGAVCQEAENRATDEAAFRKQLGKLGDSFFELKECNVYTDDQSFVMVSAINELRRQVVSSLEEQLVPKRILASDLGQPKANEKIKFASVESETYIGVKSVEQLAAVYDALDDYASCDIAGVILDLFITPDDMVLELVGKLKANNIKIALRLPYVIRENKSVIIENELKTWTSKYDFEEVYVGGLDAYGLVRQYFGADNIRFDEGQYIFNNFAEDKALSLAGRYTASYENSGKELYEYHIPEQRDMVVYGYIPLMHSANCLLKTFNKCNKNANNSVSIKDESGRSFFVSCNHRLCLNTIYNCVPLNLFKNLSNMISGNMAGRYRIEFTIEDARTVKEVLSAYVGVSFGEDRKLEENMSTSGHYKRGVD